MSENKLAQVFHFDLYGKRNAKYDFLNNNSLDSIEWNELELKQPNLFFVPKILDENSSFHYGFKLDNLFNNKNTGIQTKRDALCLQNEKSNLEQIKKDFLSLSDNEIRSKYELVEDNRDWKISFAREDLKINQPKFVKIIHRPFDTKWTFYTGKSKGFIGYPRHITMQHMLSGNNYALLLGRQNKSGTVDSFFITSQISEMKCAERTIQSYHFPLYLYPEANEQTDMFAVAERTPNLNMEIVKQIADNLSLEFEAEKTVSENTFAPIDLLDYIYAVLHSPTYREKYKEFLKIDFPRVPYPQDAETFWKLVNLGGEIRQIHLLESAKVTEYITQYPIDGDNVVGKVRFENGKVWINETQYFDNVPEIAWQFYIGGYQPAQKWLKDRKERTLNFEDIFHYQKIIVALSETDSLMREIDEIKTN
jgi:predicted helicase